MSRTMLTRKGLGVAVAVTLLVGLTAGTAALTRAAAAPEAKQAVGSAKALSQAFRSASQAVLPSVVTIQKVSTPMRPASRSQPSPRNPFEGTPFEDFFKEPQFRRFFEELPDMPHGGQVGMGSGVIIDSSGIILTNNHVVAGDGEITVRLHDGRVFKAKEVKTDRRTDLAVVRIEGAGSLQPAKLADSDTVEIGDWVVAIGNPFGLEATVTAGIISAKGRGIGIIGPDGLEDFLQTDAAINPGNSGGPLVNLDGEVVGINTAISTRTGGYQGVGFAIPANLAKGVSRQLIESGTVRRSYLGVGIQLVTQELADYFGVKVQDGALVSEVLEGSPGAKAGLKPGDIVVEFAGKKVANPHDLQVLVASAPIDSGQPIVVVHDGKRVALQVVLRKQPANYGLAQRSEGGSISSPDTSAFEDLGVEVGPLTPDVAEQLGMKGVQGVIITSVAPGSAADLAGLKSSVVIVEVGRKPVKTVEGFREALKKARTEKGVLLLVRTEGGSRYLILRTSGK